MAKANRSMESFKDKMFPRVFAGLWGFLIGDLIIGGLIWLFYSLSTGHWGTTVQIRLISGIVCGVLAFIAGERILYPVLDYMDRRDRRAKRSRKKVPSNKSL